MVSQWGRQLWSKLSPVPIEQPRGVDYVIGLGPTNQMPLARCTRPQMTTAPIPPPPAPLLPTPLMSSIACGWCHKLFFFYFFFFFCYSFTLCVLIHFRFQFDFSFSCSFSLRLSLSLFVFALNFIFLAFLFCYCFAPFHQSKSKPVIHAVALGRVSTSLPRVECNKFGFEFDLNSVNRRG